MESARTMLSRMVTRKELKKQTFDFGVADLYMLPPTSKLKGYDKFRHEKGGADLFTSYYPHLKELTAEGKYTGWSFEPSIGSDRGDRALRIDDFTLYFEVDRCTEGMKIVEQKIESYMRHADRTRERFHVVFAIMGDDNKIRLRGDSLTRLFASKKRGNQFLAANHANLVKYPFGNFLMSPKDGALSLRALQ